MRRSTKIWLSFCIHRFLSSLVSALSQFLHITKSCFDLELIFIKADELTFLNWVLLCDTQCVLALADQGLSVIFPLRSHSDELKGIGAGTELPVCWLHFTTGTVGKVNTTNWILQEEEHVHFNAM